MSLDSPATADNLESLRLQILREQVQRARAMTPEQRLAEAFSLTNAVFVRMHEGAMHRLATTDREEGWAEVRRQLERLRRVRDAGRFATSRQQSP